MLKQLSNTKKPVNNQNFNLKKVSSFDGHRLASYICVPEVGLYGYIVIHRGGLNTPAFGATRMWNYKHEADALDDALRLSRIMSYKSAMAGLPYGGAKAVLMQSGKHNRKKLLEAYARSVNYLGGHFVTGADVGIRPDEVKQMAEYTKYVVGIKSDPVKFTVLGVYASIEVCLKEVFGNADFSNRTFAIQGLGKTGLGLLELLYSKAKEIYVADINDFAVKEVAKKYPHVKPVSIDQIYKQKSDVFSPCALSSAINVKNISKINCQIIVGAANNQLENKHIGDVLHKLGILYAPDYIVNAGGLVTVVDEYEYKGFDEKRVTERITVIKRTLKRVIEQSKQTHLSPHRVADEMAEKLFHKFEQ